MGRRNIIEADTKKQNPMLPVIGFVIMAIVGGVSFWASPGMVRWLKTTNFKLGGFVPVLPIEFPEGWPPLANQLAVTLFLFIFIFALAMTVMFFVTGQTGLGENDVSLDEIRREKEKKMKRR
jgi:hypothetical protein